MRDGLLFLADDDVDDAAGEVADGFEALGKDGIDDVGDELAGIAETRC